MKLLSYGLDRRMEPRLAFSLRGYAVDVMRASLWMKEDRNAQEFLNLPSSMRLALEAWGSTFSLLKQLEESFGSISIENLSVHRRPVALPESDIVYFAPVPDAPSIRYFKSFSGKRAAEYDFGQTQTVLGHREAVYHTTLVPKGEIAAIVSADKDGSTPGIAGYSVFNNWVDPDQHGGLSIGKASSMGPWLVTVDEIDPHKLGTGFSLDMELRINGQPEGAGRFNKMNFSFSEMLQVSSETRVMAGDILCSGSPAPETPGLKRSDRVEVEVQGLGVLESTIE